MSRQKSYKATNLANLVVDKIKNKETVNLQDLSVRVGYSKKSAIAQKGVQTKTYQSIVVPVLQRMEQIRDKALLSIAKRDLDKEKLDSVVNLTKQMTHDTQLLSGKSTENTATNIIVYGKDDFLATQVSNT